MHAHDLASGRLQPAAISVIESVEVLDAKMVCAGQAASSFARSARFTPKSSNTASITRSQAPEFGVKCRGKVLSDTPQKPHRAIRLSSCRARPICRRKASDCFCALRCRRFGRKIEGDGLEKAGARRHTSAMPAPTRPGGAANAHGFDCFGHYRKPNSIIPALISARSCDRSIGDAPDWCLPRFA